MSNSTQKSASKSKSARTVSRSQTAGSAISGSTGKQSVKVMFADGHSVWGTLREYSASGATVNVTGVDCVFPNVTLVEADIDGNFNEHLTASAISPEQLPPASMQVRLGLLCPHSFSNYAASLQ